MRKFKVLVIRHQLKNQVLADFGTVVNEDQLNNNADELVKQGFVELVKEDSKQLELVEEKEVKTETKVSKK